MKSKHIPKDIQLTIRNVPLAVKNVLAKRAGRDGKSLNSILVEALIAAADLQAEAQRYTDLDHLAGRWVEDADFDAVIREQHQIDKTLWQ